MTSQGYKLTGGNVPGLVECDFCHLFFNPDTLVLHRKLHYREFFFTCLDCEKNFLTSAGLEAHRCGVNGRMTRQGYKLTGGNVPGLVECEYCHQYFNPDTLLLHRKLHYRECFFSCLDCGKNFLTSAGLEAHRCGVIDKMVPLVEMCRRAILQRMGKERLEERIMSLELPHTLKDYLLHRNK